MKIISVNILDCRETEKIEIDENLEGKLIEGIEITSYNSENDKITTFLPKDTYVKAYKETKGMFFHEIIPVLLNTTLKVKRKAWKDEYIQQILLNDRPVIYKFYMIDGKDYSCMFKMCQNLIYYNDWEVISDE